MLSWDDARAYCQENVPYNIGDLASIPDAGTNDFLQTLIQDAYIWVGGLRNDSTNSTSTWTWSDGTPWDEQNTFWFDGQPNNGVYFNLNLMSLFKNQLEKLVAAKAA